MDDDGLRADLVRLYAADYGARCPLVPPSGPAPVAEVAALRVRCRTAVQARLAADAAGLRVWLAQTAREVFLSEQALRRGLGLEDAADFWVWFDQALWTGPAGSAGSAARRPAAATPTR